MSKAIIENQRISIRTNLEVLISFDLIITTSITQSADESAIRQRQTRLIDNGRRHVAQHRGVEFEGREAESLEA